MGHLGTQSRGCAGQTVRPSLHSISQTSAGKLFNGPFELLLCQWCRLGSRRIRHNPRLICATACEHRPGDAGEFIGQRDRQHVAVEPL